MHKYFMLFLFTIVSFIPSAQADKMLSVGDAAPNFTLPNKDGEMRTLADLLKDGPVILSFYRGGWCPICNDQLQSYQKDLKSFTDRGAQLVAISPEKPKDANDTAVKNAIEFEVLSDEGNKVARAYDLVWTVPEENRAGLDKFVMKKTGVTLAEYNGLDTYELPIPATFIISTEGKVAYVFRDKNYKKRVKNNDLLQVLEGDM